MVKNIFTQERIEGVKAAAAKLREQFPTLNENRLLKKYVEHHIARARHSEDVEEKRFHYEVASIYAEELEELVDLLKPALQNQEIYFALAYGCCLDGNIEKATTILVDFLNGNLGELEESGALFFECMNASGKSHTQKMQAALNVLIKGLKPQTFERCETFYNKYFKGIAFSEPQSYAPGEPACH